MPNWLCMNEKPYEWAAMLISSNNQWLSMRKTKEQQCKHKTSFLDTLYELTVVRFFAWYMYNSEEGHCPLGVFISIQAVFWSRIFNFDKRTNVLEALLKWKTLADIWFSSYWALKWLRQKLMFLPPVRNCMFWCFYNIWKTLTSPESSSITLFNKYKFNIICAK